MCRHLAYLGPELRLPELLFDKPHSLLHQTWAPSDMRGGGTVNVDGFGVGWYTPDEPEPVRYRRSIPMWTDASFASIARRASSTAVLAAVRSATIGMPVSENACAPFAEGAWLFSHNGIILGWPESVASLAERLPVVDLVTLEAPTDSALLWALLRDRLRAGEPADEAVAAVTLEIAEAAPGSRLNLLLTNGRELVATTWWHSLSVLHTPDAVVVSSEPWDDDEGWSLVDDRSIVHATLDSSGQPTVRIRPL